MRIGDTILTKTENLLGDEYEKQVYHQASTVAVTLMPVFILIMGAILGWVLPGFSSLWALLVLIPLLGPNIVHELWMRSRAPRPAAKLRDGMWGLTAVNLILSFTMLFGIAYNVPENAGSLVWGGIVGGVAALVFTPLLTKIRRERDEERLNAELED